MQRTSPFLSTGKKLITILSTQEEKSRQGANQSNPPWIITKFHESLEDLTAASSSSSIPFLSCCQSCIMCEFPLDGVTPQPSTPCRVPLAVQHHRHHQRLLRLHLNLLYYLFTYVIRPPHAIFTDYTYHSIRSPQMDRCCPVFTNQ